MVCSQHYSQREWILGDLVDQRGGSVFKIRKPFTFHSTVELMKVVHEHVGTETVAIEVIGVPLRWTRSSFVEAAAVVGKKVVAAENLAAACKCGAIPRVKAKKRARQPTKKATPGAPASATDDGIDSDDSLLDALAKELERGRVPFADSVDDPGVDLENENDSAQSEHVRSLVAAVASSCKYKDCVTVTEARFQVDHTPKPKEDLKKIQELEGLLDERNVSAAMKTLKSKPVASSSASSHSVGGTQQNISQHDVSQCLDDVKSLYGGQIGPEEEAEEGILALASFGTAAGAVDSVSADDSMPSSLHSRQLFDDKDVTLWAEALAATAASFHELEGELFPIVNDFDASMYRCVSLVQFLESETTAEIDSETKQHLDHIDQSDANSDHEDEGQAVDNYRSTYVQFVHWDVPEPPTHVGRCLRIEAQRLVWKPPARSMKYDSLGDLFRSGSARVILVTWSCKVKCFPVSQV